MDYSAVKTTKLQLKGLKRKKKHKKEKRDDGPSSSSKSSRSHIDEKELADRQSHGGWTCCDSVSEVTGNIAIELTPHSYIRALDNGMFIASAPHQAGEPPDQEEILTAIKVGGESEGKIALKSGFGKYLTVDPKSNRIMGVADAIGQRELFEPVFQDGKVALCACNSCFILPDEDRDGIIVATSAKADEMNFIKIRVHYESKKSKADDSNSVPSEERGSLQDCEVNYLKKYQSYQGKKPRVETDHSSLKSAQATGTLHEALLDRRSKMKSDKFCK